MYQVDSLVAARVVAMNFTNKQAEGLSTSGNW